MILLWIGSFTSIAMASTPMQLLTGVAVFVFTVAFGVLLLRSVISEVETREQLQVANAALADVSKAKSEFMSFATHQLRAPLTSISGYLALLTDGTFGEPTPQMRAMVDKVVASARTMSHTIDDFLNASKIDQGKIEYTKRPFDVRELVRAVVFEEQIQAGMKHIALLEENDGAPLMVNGDEPKLRQSVTNIIENAIKYTPEGHVKVAVFEKDGSVLIEVSDTGIGISAEDQAKLFEKFARGSGARAQGISGTGVGLFVAREMVEAHGGEVEVKSDGEGQGTTMTIRLLLIHSAGLMV